MPPASDHELIAQIEAIRAENNRRWMDLVRLAFRCAPAEAREIMASIIQGDADVSDAAKRLAQVD